MRKTLQLEIDIQLYINDSLKSILINNFFKDIPLELDKEREFRKKRKIKSINYLVNFKKTEKKKQIFF